MNDLEELYQEIILDHNKRPRNYGPLDSATHLAEGFNPLCGDQLTVSLAVEDGRVKEVHFEGEGCAISKASASLMTTHLNGRSVDEVKAAVDQLLQMLTTPAGETGDMPAGMGNVAALAGVRRFPVRVKCATLAWHTCAAALAGRNQVSTE